MKIYVVNGFPRSGKTTFESYVKKISCHYCYILSTIDCIKELVRPLGWKGAKEPKDRKMLAELKRILTEWGDIPMKKLRRDLDLIQLEVDTYRMQSEQVCVFIDCREPEEIKRICDEFGAKSMLIQRESVKNEEASNEADKNVLDYEYDIVINNDGNLRDLALRAIDFIDEEGLYIDHNRPLEINLYGEIQYIK